MLICFVGCWLQITQSVEISEYDFWNFQNSKLYDLLFTIFKRYLFFFATIFFSKIVNWPLVGNFEFLLTDSKRYLLGMQIISLVLCNFGRENAENRDNPEYHWNDEKTLLFGKSIFSKNHKFVFGWKIWLSFNRFWKILFRATSCKRIFHDFGRKCREFRVEMCPKSWFPGGSKL